MNDALIQNTDDHYLKIQLQLEREALGLGFERFDRKQSGRPSKEANAIGKSHVSSSISRHSITVLHTQLATELRPLVRRIENNGAASTPNAKKRSETPVYQAVKMMDSIEDVAVITLKLLFDTLTCLSNNIEDDKKCRYINLADELGGILHAVCNKDTRKAIEGLKWRAAQETPWLRIGGTLISLAVEESNYFHVERGRYNYIRKKPLHDTWQLMQEKNIARPLWSPLVIEPKPWETMRSGGYHGVLAGRMTLIKGRNSVSGFSLAKCPEVFNAVTHIQNTPFRIYQSMFHIFSSLFEMALGQFKERIETRRKASARTSPDQRMKIRNGSL